MGSPPVNTFPGLRPFREDEAHLFFGRERQIDRMIDKLRPARFLAIVGTSGSGKSSLVNCGLRPALYRGRMLEAGTAWRFAQCRPGNNPILALAQALAEPGVLFVPAPSEDPAELMLDEVIDATLRISALGLVDIYQQAYPRGGMNLLVVIDQFEELFRYRNLTAGGAADPHRYGPSEESIAFVKLLLEASAQRDYPIYVALTMRSDFLGDCSQLDGLPEAINEGQYLVPRMTRADRRTAIEGPVAVGGRRINPVLLTRLVNDVGDNPDQLSILQHALNRTWARSAHDAEAMGELLPSHYDDIGSMAHALDRHADKAWGELTTPRQREICEKVFRALTDTGADPRGIRRPTQLSSLCELSEASPQEVAEVLAVFRKPSRSFLMPPLAAPPAADILKPNTVIDISHESLMRVWEKLKGWAEKEARSARLYRRVSETSTLYKEGKAGLLRDRELETVVTWMDAEKPNDAWARQYQGDWKSVEAFVEESRRAHHRELAEMGLDNRWRKFWRPISLGVFLLIWLYPAARINIKNFSEAQKTHEASHKTPETGLGGKSFPDEPEFIWPFVCLSLSFTALVTGLGGVEWGGRRVFRSVAFDRILNEVSTRVPAEQDTGKAVRTAEESATAAADYPAWWKRLVAWFIDLIISIVMNVLFLIGMIYGNAALSSLGETAILSLLFGGILAMDWLYDVLLTRSRWQGTVGMRAMRIMVTDLAGNRLSFGRATARHFAKILCWLTSFLGFATALFTAKKQGLHELIARCVTVRRPLVHPASATEVS